MPPSASIAARRARAKAQRRPSPWGMFFVGFLKRPVMVGSIVPSSRRTIERVLGRVDWDRTRLFVEYGPGVGTFCQSVLDRLPADATYLAIDTNPDFVAYLRDTIHDPRFSVVHGSAADVDAIIADHGHDAADYVLSGLPLTTLPPGVADRIAAATLRVLRPGGAFLVYQFNPKVGAILAPHFALLDHAIEWWNVPPAQLYWGWKS